MSGEGAGIEELAVELVGKQAGVRGTGAWETTTWEPIWATTWEATWETTWEAAWQGTRCGLRSRGR